MNLVPTNQSWLSGPKEGAEEAFIKEFVEAFKNRAAFLSTVKVYSFKLFPSGANSIC